MPDHRSLAEAQEDALRRLTSSDAVGQLRRREGTMARLGSEGAALKLDWVEAIPWLLAHPEALAAIEAEAAVLVERGIRNIVWSGMGGSVLTVQVLWALGFCDGPPAIYPLDSTDPDALNALLRALLARTAPGQPASALGERPDVRRALLDDTLMIAVAMGMTSEEPISHLAWFCDALTEAGLSLPEHVRAMSLPDSYLDTFARERDIPRLALQLDGGSGTGGRMSAPGTRVFLLPVALWLAAQRAPHGALALLLARAWTDYDLDSAQRDPASHPYVRLAAALSAASVNGAVRLSITAPGLWGVVRDWAEQLFEESLGKGGKGVVIFAEEGQTTPAQPTPGEVWLRISTVTHEAEPPGVFTFSAPLLASAHGEERLAGLASLFLGLQLTTALYGYLQDIPFAGQPAVEDYKARARALRDGAGDPLPQVSDPLCVSDGPWSLYAPHELIANATERTPHAVALAALRRLPTLEPLPYLDLTINGELPPAMAVQLHERLRTLAPGRLGVPYKLRRAPAAYHSTEQSEMDGPPALVSVRVLATARATRASGSLTLIGDYSARFLAAQAVATWQAMTGVGRACLLLLYHGEPEAMYPALLSFLDALAADLI